VLAGTALGRPQRPCSYVSAEQSILPSCGLVYTAMCSWRRAYAAKLRRAALQACVIKYDEEVGTRQQTCAAAASALAQVEPWFLPSRDV